MYLVRARYPLDVTLDVVGTQYNVTDAHAYLLERTGDKTGALNLILGALQRNTTSLQVIHLAEVPVSVSVSVSVYLTVSAVVHAVVLTTLCPRSCIVMYGCRLR